MKFPRLQLGLIALTGMLVILFFAAPGYSKPQTEREGNSKMLLQAADEDITVYLYRPPACEPAGLLFVFHGLNRKAKSVRKKAKKIARRACLIVLAPLLDKAHFPNWRYHRAGVIKHGKIKPRRQWSDIVLRELIEHARKKLQMPNARIYLFGHSAGAQFLSRLAAYGDLPAVERIVIANPSVYVAPSLTEPVPYGFAGIFSELQARQRLKAYLALPITLYLGQQDTGNKYLVRSDGAMRQGRNRLERGRRMFAAAQHLARIKNWPFNWQRVEVAGIGHSSGGMLRADELMQALGLKKSAQPLPKPAYSAGGS